METAERIRRLVEEHGPLAVPDIARRLHTDRRRLYDPIRALERAGQIHLVRHGRRLVASATPASKAAAARAALPPPLARLHVWLQENPGHDQATIARHWQGRGWKRSTIQYRLARLESQGLAARRGQGRGAAWHAA